MEATVIGLPPAGLPPPLAPHSAAPVDSTLDSQRVSAANRSAATKAAPGRGLSEKTLNGAGDHLSMAGSPPRTVWSVAYCRVPCWVRD